MNQASNSAARRSRSTGPKTTLTGIWILICGGCSLAVDADSGAMELEQDQTGLCASGSDCPADNECSANTCIPRRACAEDAPCEDGQVCIEDVCRATCTAPDSCEAQGLQCDLQAGLCLPLPNAPAPADPETTDMVAAEEPTELTSDGDTTGDPATLPGPPSVDLRIDDLEDGDERILELAGRTGRWHSFNDGTGQQAPAIWELPVPAAPGASGSSLAMHTSGSGFREWGAGIELDLNNPGDEVTDPRRAIYDLSPYEGLSFRARGSASTRLRLQAVTSDVAITDEAGSCTPNDLPCFDTHGVMIPLQDDWEEYRIPFSNLEQGGWGQAFTFAPSRVLALAFQHLVQEDNSEAPFDFWLDDLALYQDASAAAGTSTGSAPDGPGSGPPNSIPPGNADASSDPSSETPGAGACNAQPQGYGSDQGSVTMYWFDQGTVTPNCSYEVAQRGMGSDSVEGIQTGSGGFFGAMNTSDYADAATCGACVEVSRDDGRSVLITIVDQCPVDTNNKCVAGHIDLSVAAFREIGSDDEGYLGARAGTGQISWRHVACPPGEGLRLSLKEPGNDFWNELLVQGHRYPLDSVEVRVDGRWVETLRQRYNYWRPPGGDMGEHLVRVTDINGATVEAEIPLESGVASASQFPLCQ